MNIFQRTEPQVNKIKTEEQKAENVKVEEIKNEEVVMENQTQIKELNLADRLVETERILEEAHVIEETPLGEPEVTNTLDEATPVVEPEELEEQEVAEEQIEESEAVTEQDVITECEQPCLPESRVEELQFRLQNAQNSIFMAEKEIDLLRNYVDMLLAYCKLPKQILVEAQQQGKSLSEFTGKVLISL